ncbi:flagellar hook-associated protein FlgL [Thauera chlorobenzoica]|uniref:Flagellar hook-associated protein FlgL n=1 Tax=Thauera chlorobenzoica TaxID=96773 RepID=A0A1H5W9V9_9RHOO|nr:flagellar hook-associated protein FlgL [Thauera chlorobenzoica]APR03239.1 Flagellar hook-associated protein FlgL [Thauera chlorobenzoica]SEF96244.1 flagellar hook-associated protein 3 FlgL [Thauera chlorobenzoica]
MRISTVTVYEQSVSSMNRQQAGFLKTGQQIASGRRVVNPSDDPQAASRAVGVSQAKAVTEQYADARVGARNALAQTESVLDSLSSVLERTRTLLVQASSDTLGDADRQSVASELRGLYEVAIGQANATDGNGRYLFGGYQDGSPPFQKDGSGNIEYNGDSNARALRIDASRLMQVAENGENVFLSVPGTAGHLACADEGNAGSVTFTGPSVVDATVGEHRDRHRVAFAIDAGGAQTYTVSRYDEATSSWAAVPGLEDLTYESGKPVTFAGLSMVFAGDPADGDRFEVAPAQKMDPDIFRSFEQVLAVLETPADTPMAKAALRNTLNTAMREFANAQDNVLTVRASAGARLNELDVVDSVGANRMLNYEQTLSDLVDLDYVQAASDYSLRQVGLQASYEVFTTMKTMSLFSRM